MLSLGIAYFEGHGVAQSLSMAQQWCEQANCDHDNPEAQKILDTISAMMAESHGNDGIE